MKQYIFLFLILFSNILLSVSPIKAENPVYSEPIYPTEFDSIIVYFDATKGDQGLMDYEGDDVYAHTGVITEFSTQPSEWRYVIAGWNVNTEKARLVQVGENLWKLTVGYPHEYYVSHETDESVPDSEQILKLAFVFRNLDGSRTGRDVGGKDIFLDLYSPGITTIVIEPYIGDNFGLPERNPVFAKINEDVKISATAATIGTELDSLKLFASGTQIFVTTDDTLSYNLSFNSTGMNHVEVVGITASDISDTAKFCIMVPEIFFQNRPENIVDGINYIDDNIVILSLFAPYKEFVYVIGNFNDWKVQEEYCMRKEIVSPDSEYYWIRIEDLEQGIEYAFQYLVDGEIRIADPYSPKVLDPWNDKYIPEEIYPNLEPYPEGKTEEIVGVFRTDPPEFGWQATDYEKPPKEKLVIYELLIRDFLEKHDYKTLKDTLDYLQNLGINAIELMPISEFEGNSSWGYNPSFYFAPDKYYGPSEDLKEFIDECHSRNIAVIMDIVLNHSYGQSPLVRLYWDTENSRPAANNPWYNQVSPNPIYSWGYDFDHESSSTKYFVDRVTQHWLTEYKFDGFRFDFTKGFTNTSGDGGAYDESRINILKRIADEIWNVDSSAYIILEHFTDNSEEKVLSNYGMILWGNANRSYAQASMGYQEDSDFSWGFYKTRGWTEPNLVTYMESHDEERIMYKNLQWGDSLGGYNIKELSTALDRIKLVSAFFLTLPGPKMIWQFGELGYDYSINYNGRLGEKPIKWDYLEDWRRKNLYKTISALIKLRSENEVFTSKNTNVDMSVGGYLKWIRLSGSPNVVIIGNFNVIPGSIDPNFQHSGSWYDYFSGDTIEVVDSHSPMDLTAGEFHIFTDQKLETPILDISAERLSDLPNGFHLYQNYPNPFNANTIFTYSLEKRSNIHLQIFDILGREVYSENLGYQNPGWHRYSWNGKNKRGECLNSGIYFFVLKNEKESRIQKITFLK
jgi:glycosidase